MSCQLLAGGCLPNPVLNHRTAKPSNPLNPKTPKLENPQNIDILRSNSPRVLYKMPHAYIPTPHLLSLTP